MAVQIQLRRDTAANWTTADPVLAEGETGWETDTGAFKLGDGVTAWTALAYAGGGGGGAVSSVNGQTGVVVLDAADIDYDNAVSGLTAADVQAAIDELAAGSGGSAAWGAITGTLSAQTDLQTALDAKAADRSTVTNLSIASGVVNIDCALGDFFTLSLTANVTSITFSNLPAAGKGASIAVRIRQDATGSRTVALPSSFKATGGSDTAVQSAANAYTLLTMTTFDQGTRWEYAMQDIAA